MRRAFSTSSESNRFLGRKKSCTLNRVTRGSGQVLERYEYGDYGLPTVLSQDGITQRPESAFGNSRMFTGRLWDKESRLYQ